MSDKKKVEPWHLEEWNSGNDTIDKAIWELMYGLSDKERERASHRLIKIGDAAVPTILKALRNRNTTYVGFAFFAGHCEENILPLEVLGAIGSPLAFPVLRKLHKLARKEKIYRSGVLEHRQLFSAIEHALHKCDQRWWKKLFRSRH